MSQNSRQFFAISLSSVLLSITFPASAGTSSSCELPPLGINVAGDGIADWGPDWVFADVMKQARVFGAANAPWAIERRGEISVDQNGWPTGDAGVMVFSGSSNPSGIYKLSFKGEAVRVTVNDWTELAVHYDPATQISTADVQYSGGNMWLSFFGVPGGVKDVRLMRPWNDSSAIFDKHFLDRLGAGNNMFGIVRFMGATATNNNRTIEWADRTTKNYATQNRPFGSYSVEDEGQTYWSDIAAGMAWEYVIELSNLTGKDPWINIPHKASDDYIRKLALLFKNSLNSDRKIYVEFSNETWNGIFSQRYDLSKAGCDEVVNNGDPNHYTYDYAEGRERPDKTACREEGQPHEFTYGALHSAWRLKRTSEIFREVFGDAAMMTRVRPILAGQLANYGVLDMQLDYIDGAFGPLSRHIYGISGAVYVNVANKPGDPKEGEWYVSPNKLELSLNDVLDRMRLYNSDPQYLKDPMAHLRSKADQYGVKMFAYEGGTHLWSDETYPNGHPKAGQLINYEAYLQANVHPDMEGILETTLQNWRDAGGDTFVYFDLVSDWSSKQFGLSNDLRNENTLKWKAVKDKATEWSCSSPAPVHYTHVDVTTQVENGVTLTTINGELVSHAEHYGKNTAVFVFANLAGTDNWLLLNPNSGWHLWADCNSTAIPYATGTMPWVTDIALFYNADLSAFTGSPILFGYGEGSDATAACVDMFNNTRWAHVTTL